MTVAPALELRQVARSYAEGRGRLDIFGGLDLTLHAGEIVALVGHSGSGKSSLLHIAGLLEAPTAGQVLVAGQNCTDLDDAARTRIRRIGIGFVYQFHHLLPEFSALENVVMPQLIAGARRNDADKRATELLDRLGLAARMILQGRPPVTNLYSSAVFVGWGEDCSGTAPSCALKVDEPLTIRATFADGTVVELDLPDGAGAAVVGDVVDGAAEGVDGVHRLPPLLRQQAHRRVEGGAGGGQRRGGALRVLGGRGGGGHERIP